MTWQTGVPYYLVNASPDQNHKSFVKHGNTYYECVADHTKQRCGCARFISRNRRYSWTLLRRSGPGLRSSAPPKRPYRPTPREALATMQAHQPNSSPVKSHPIRWTHSWSMLPDQARLLTARPRPFPHGSRRRGRLRPRSRDRGTCPAPAASNASRSPAGRLRAGPALCSLPERKWQVRTRRGHRAGVSPEAGRANRYAAGVEVAVHRSLHCPKSAGAWGMAAAIATILMPDSSDCRSSSGDAGAAAGSVCRQPRTSSKQASPCESQPVWRSRGK